ncbi:MAG: hypothetical protein ABW123_16605 [Cystobacter sp.]
MHTTITRARLPIWGGALLLLLLEGCATGAPRAGMLGPRRPRPTHPEKPLHERERDGRPPAVTTFML